MRPRWLIDLHGDFPGSAIVAAALDDALIVEPRDVMVGRWPVVQEGRAVVGYGTMQTMMRLRRVRELGEAVFDDYVTLRCSSYYRYVYDLLGRTAVLVPFSAIPELPLRRMFDSDQVFVRSDTNYKLFPAGVHAIAELGRWLQTYDQHRHELVVVSEVVPFEREYRCFCRDGRFVCGSSYPVEPYLPVPDHVRAFAETAAGRLLAHGPTMLTVDVGVSPDGTLRLVEVGGVNSWASTERMSPTSSPQWKPRPSPARTSDKGTSAYSIARQPIREPPGLAQLTARSPACGVGSRPHWLPRFGVRTRFRGGNRDPLLAVHWRL